MDEIVTEPTSPEATQVVLVTGRSGAGRSTAVASFEDFGFETVDKPPIAFVPGIAGALAAAGHKDVAIGLDAGTVGFSVAAIADAVSRLREMGGQDGRPPMDVHVLFLTCADDVLRRRYTETRRRHPLAPTGSIDEGLARDRAEVMPLREMASLVFDTSTLLPHDLKRELRMRFARSDAPGLSISVLSFSYKRGLPPEADIVLDCRFLRNPHYQESLRDKTGRSPDVAGYVAADPQFVPFLEKTIDLVSFLLPAFHAEGKSYLTVAFGCTGGKHRSVATAEAVGRRLNELGWGVSVRHREQADSASKEDKAEPVDRSDTSNRTNAA